MANTLDGNTFFFFNKKYEHAKLAQFGTGGGRDVGTYEQAVCTDQLWMLEESKSKPGWYYIKNVKHEGYRLAKWGLGDKEVGVFNGQFFSDQLWKFKQEGEYYRVFNYKYSSAKIAKFSKNDRDWGTYSKEECEDQLWKLVPRFKAKAKEVDLFNPIDNR